VILSDKHKFVFIKGMKVAGTSAEMALSGLCGPNDIVTPISPVDELARGCHSRNYSTDRAAEIDYLDRLKQTKPEDLETVPGPRALYYNHMSLREVLQLYPRPLTGFRIVGIERSPYAKVISWANMRLTYGQYRSGAGEMRASHDAIRAYVDQSLENGRILDCRNIDRYRGPDGRLAVTLMRYAHLQDDFTAFVASLGIAPVPPLPHVKKGLMSDTLDPRTVLSPAQIAQIGTLFAEEFDAYGYPHL
jgi:hypothetical protein